MAKILLPLLLSGLSLLSSCSKKAPEPASSPESAPAQSVSEAPAVIDEEYVLSALKKALADRFLTAGDLSLSGAVEASAMGLTFDIDISAEVAARMQEEPFYSYTDSRVSVTFSGNTAETPTLSYTREENGKLITYSSVNGGATFQRNASNESAAELVQKVKAHTWLQELEPSDVKLDQGEPSYEGKSVCILRFTLSGKAIAAAAKSFSSSGSLMPELTDEAMEALSADTVLYLDRESFLPLRMEMELSGADELVANFAGRLAGDALSFLSPTFKTDTLSLVADHISYEPQEMPALPPNIH